MFRNRNELGQVSTSTTVSLALMACYSFLTVAASVAACQVDLAHTVALRYTSDGEVGRLPQPEFLLLGLRVPSEQRTRFECASVGSFEEWVRNRKPWKTPLKFHYYESGKGFVSVSEFPTDPRPEEVSLVQADVQFLRMLIVDQFGGKPPLAEDGAMPPDLQKIATLLGAELVAKLLPQVAVGGASTVAGSLAKALWRERTSIAAGTKLLRSITSLETTDGRRIVRILTVLQVRESLLPFDNCYYASALDDVDLQYSQGLLIPPGGLGFIPAFVGSPLYVYILDKGPSVEEVTKSVGAAVAIWKKAGVVLSPIIKVLDKKETVALLGKDEKIPGYLGCATRFNALATRERLAAIKPNKNSLALFFSSPIFFDGDSTQSEPELQQAYIGYDPNSGSPGLSIAHEIGHLFFGAGHVGEEARGPCLDPSDQHNSTRPVAFTSGLMEFPQRSREITYQDAIFAKKAILARPDARWW
jgi:hypothetical protein